MSIEQKLYDLLTWIKTFEVARDITSISEITDGLVVGQVLNFISPTFFTEQWLTGIKSEANGNWEMKCLNLKYIVRAMVEFLSPITDRLLLEQLVPDVMAIVNRDDEEAIFRLLQLVLGCAVNSESKQTHIHSILCMQESVQHALMEAIQQLMPSGTGMHDNLLSPAEEYGSLIARRDTLAQQCHDLEYQVSQLRNEKALLESETQHLRRAGGSSKSSSTKAAATGTATTTTAEEAASGAAPAEGVDLDQDSIQQEDLARRVARSNSVLSPTVASVRIGQLQDQVTKLRTELYRVEAAKEEQSIRLTDALAHNDDLVQKCEQLSKRAEQASQLKDELDIVREELSSVLKTSANLEKLRRRADEANELRTRCAKLETDNAVCLERMAELEQEARLSSNLRSQIESHRLEATSLRQEATRARERAGKTEAELKLVKEELTAVIGERTRLVYELNRHQSRNEEFQIYNLSSDNTVGEEDSLEYKHLGEDLHRQLATSMSSLDVTSQSGQPSLRCDATTWTGPVPLTSASEHQSAGDQADSHVADQLRAQLAERDEQLMQMEQRYRGYLWKAKEVIRLLDKQRRSLQEQRQSGTGDVATPAGDEVDRLRALLVQKEAVIERLEQHLEQTRRQRDLEERVVLAAWYNLAGHMLRESSSKEDESSAKEDQEGELIAANNINNSNSESADQLQTVSFSGAPPHTASLLDRQREIHLKPPHGLTSIVMARDSEQ